MTRHRALIVDDEPDILELVSITLARMEIDCLSAENVAQAKAALTAPDLDFCLTDMRLPDGSGLDIVRYIQQARPELPVAVITAHGSMETAVEALKAGAFDFVSKPVDLKVLRNLVDSALRLSETRDFPQRDRRTRNELIGDSPPMQRLRALIARVARSQAPVYISGESGTGKELVARLIHRKGPRAEGPFVAVNCGAIPAELVESEFFGHRKGSFTGATSNREGLFQAAEGGTLFLDEVADLPLPMQVKLLRAIQEKTVRPIGADREIPVNVRILSASHKPLAQLVEQGTFRQDLYYRLNVIELHLPPLRERREDIPRLAEHLLERIGNECGRRFTLAPEAVETLQAYPFPGNVRELENVLERAAALCETEVIQVDDLHLAPTGSPVETPAPVSEPLAEDDIPPLEDYLDRVERDTILRALEATGHNKTAAARKLGITFRALRYRLKKLGLE